jgi:hypothetical protein
MFIENIDDAYIGASFKHPHVISACEASAGDDRCPLVPAFLISPAALYIAVETRRISVRPWEVRYGLCIVECPWCGALHVHGYSEGARRARCWPVETRRWPNGEPREYRLALAGPASERMLALYNGAWRTPAMNAWHRVEKLEDEISVALGIARTAPAIAHFQMRTVERLRRKMLAVTIGALRLHPDFAEREAILINEQGLPEQEAGQSVLLDMMAETGEAGVPAAIRALLRRYI